MANEVLYVRNTRPNAVLVKHNGIKYTVERRGSREDTTVLPAEARQDPAVNTFLQRGILEEISKDAFFALSSRGEGRPAFALQKKGELVNLPHTGETAREPFVLPDKTIDESKYLRTPRPEFAERVPSTAEEMASGIRQPLPELKRAISSLQNKEERLETQVNELSTQVAQLTALLQQQLAAQPVPGVEVEDVQTEEPKPRKTRSTGTKKTRANK